MATQQAAVAAKPGWLGKTDNALCRHFFPAPSGSRCGGRPASHGFWQGGQPWRRTVPRWIVSPQRDASDKGLRNPGLSKVDLED